MVFSKRLFQAGVYFFSIPGALLAIFVNRRDRNIMYHAFCSISMAVMSLFLLFTWFITQFVFSWIPYAGFVLGIMLFTLVAAFWIFIILCSVGAGIGSLMGRDVRIPFLHPGFQRLWMKLSGGSKTDYKQAS